MTINAIEYYPVIEKEINLEDIMPNRINKTQKEKICMNPFILGI